MNLFIGLKCVEAFSSIYTVSMGTCSKSILLFLNSNSIFVSYSNRSLLLLENNGKNFNGIALKSCLCIGYI